MGQTDKNLLTCDQCPHTVGDSYQRDCAYPDCLEQTVTNRIIQIISDIVSVHYTLITPGSVLLNDPLNFDSLDFVEVAMEIEDNAHIKIGPDGFEDVKTVGDIILKVQKEIDKK